MQKNKMLFVIASGSGGHILPALIIAKEWKKKEQGTILFFASNKKLDKSILNGSTIIDKKINLKLNNFPGKKIWLYPLFISQFLLCFLKAVFYTYKYQPNKIITTGGYLAIPVVLASKIFKSYIKLYELNVIPGKAIKFLSGIADQIAIVFEDSKQYFKKYSHKLILTNYPLRYSEADKIFDKKKLIEKINKEEGVLFTPKKKTIFLLGGSQGSIYLNNYLKKLINNHSNIINNLQIIHQTGENDKTDWDTFYKDKNLQAIVFTYKKNLKNYYLISDQVITRAGAGTLFELAFFKKKSIIFPLITKTTSHQVNNAEAMIKKNKSLFKLNKNSNNLT